MKIFKNEFATFRVRKKAAIDNVTWFVVERHDKTHDKWIVEAKHKLLRTACYAARHALLTIEEYEETRRGHPLPRKYTVMLRYPNEITDDSFNEYFTCCVAATTPIKALVAARKLVVKSSKDAGFEVENSLDFSAVAVFEGDQDNINPEA